MSEDKNQQHRMNSRDLMKLLWDKKEELKIHKTDFELEDKEFHKKEIISLEYQINWLNEQWEKINTELKGFHKKNPHKFE